MARSIQGPRGNTSGATAAALPAGIVSNTVTSFIPGNDLHNFLNTLGPFGSGFRELIYANKTFTVPSGVTSIRVRVWGPGGDGIVQTSVSSTRSTAGSGGGYAHGVFSVTPGATYTCTVGLTGTTSFGALISATAGTNGNATTPAGGTGTGGDFQATGGTGKIKGSDNDWAGGGSAGTHYGNGFAGGYYSGAGILNTPNNVSPSSGVGAHMAGRGPFYDEAYTIIVLDNAAAATPIGPSGKIGGGGAWPGGPGGDFGGGAARTNVVGPGGDGGIAGGGGSSHQSFGAGTKGGRGLMVVEW